MTRSRLICASAAAGWQHYAGSAWKFHNAASAALSYLPDAAQVAWLAAEKRDSPVLTGLATWPQACTLGESATGGWLRPAAFGAHFRDAVSTTPPRRDMVLTVVSAAVCGADAILEREAL